MNTSNKCIDHCTTAGQPPSHMICPAVVAQWQSTGGSSQRFPGFDSWHLNSFISSMRQDGLSKNSENCELHTDGLHKYVNPLNLAMFMSNSCFRGTVFMGITQKILNFCFFNEQLYRFGLG